MTVHSPRSENYALAGEIPGKCPASQGQNSGWLELGGLCISRRHQPAEEDICRQIDIQDIFLNNAA
jgi:hypothetical protein